MSISLIPEWTLDGVLDELGRIDGSMRDRQFAFILGAGASVTSKIPTGKDLAERWLRDLYLRECSDDSPLDDWVAGPALGIQNLRLDRAAEYYPEIFERRFRGDRESGYAELESAMEGRTPSLGYSLLAEIIQHTRHKVVVTTNFDNLVADALAMHAHQSPLVVAHESLTGFVRPQMRRPLVAKIHRDLFLNPKNDQEGVSTMEEGWKVALRKLFQYFTPIVVGYGGNDGSLMGLLKSLSRGEISGRMIWCYRAGSPPPPAANEVLEVHQGIQVKIPGFDEFMLWLAAKLVPNFDVAAVAERTAKLGQERAERYRGQAEELQKSSLGTGTQRRTSQVLSKSVQSGKSWWAWEIQASAETDPQERDQVYQEGLRQFPASAGLTGNYALFLQNQRKDYDAAEALFKKALELDPTHANNTGNYATFLKNQRRDYDAAEALYKKALELDPTNAYITGNYALFLKNQRRDYGAAEALYKKALELDPTNAYITGSYAVFLADQRKDYDAAEALFKKALELDPTHANNTGNYATFLKNQRRDYDAAEALYKKALELDPTHAHITGSYALFLKNQRKDYDAAEALYKKALELDPTNAYITGNYALFLTAQRKDYGAAEALFKKALELDPTNAHIAASYAVFLADQRKDYDAAEALFKKALELDPTDVNIAANYAWLLMLKGDAESLSAVPRLVRTAQTTSVVAEFQSRAEALLYGSLQSELTSVSPKPMLAGLKSLLGVDFMRADWDFSTLFDAVLPRIAPERREFYRALGAAILDPTRVSDLSPFDIWQELPSDEAS